MGTKTISITDDAYDILKSKKEVAESFSEVIVRLSGKRKLASFAGSISKKSADALEREIKVMRRIHREMYKKRVENASR